jgi:hypothetical protein
MILLTQMFIITESDTFGQLRYRTSPHLQKAIPTERFAIASPHPQNSERIPTSQKRFLGRASLSHPHILKAIANITKSSANSKQKPLKHLPPKP